MGETAIADDFIEIVGGTLKGFWITLEEGKLIVAQIEESEALRDARLDLARHEAASLRNDRIHISNQHPISSFIAQLSTLFILNRRHRSASEELERLQDEEPSVTILAAYPLDVSISKVTEAEETFVRTANADEYETERLADKEASFVRSWGHRALESSVRDGLLDDMRESPEERQTCLIVNFVDGNSAILADFDEASKSILNAASMELGTKEIGIIELILEHSGEVLGALKQDIEVAKNNSPPDTDSALERLRWSKEQATKVERLRSLAKLCEMIHSGELSRENSRYPSRQLTSLSVDLAEFDDVDSGG